MTGSFGDIQSLRALAALNLCETARLFLRNFRRNAGQEIVEYLPIESILLLPAF